MPSLCGYTWDDAIDAAVKDRAAAYGLPWDLAFWVCAVESRFDTYNSGDEVGNGAPGWDDNPTHGQVVVGADGHRGMRFPNAPGVASNYIAWESYRNPGRFDWSHGLLQLMTGGGQGAVSPGVSMTWSQLVNPWVNLDVGFPHVASAFRSCWSPDVGQFDYIHCIMSNSGHPGPIASDDYRLVSAFPVWQCFFNNLVNLGSVPPPVQPPNPPTPLPNPVPPTPPPTNYNLSSQDLAIIAAVGIVGLGMVVIGSRSRVLKKIISPDGRVEKKLIM